MNSATHWTVERGVDLDLASPRIMGILNVTPDSFSDGGQFELVEQATAHADQMVCEGAALIDVGGESTRPGAARVPSSEQIRRIIPVIEGIRTRHAIPISVDTTRADVARAALDSGATVINDVSAGQEDPEMLPLAAERQCGVVLMHRLCPPNEDSWSDQYDTTPQYGSDVAGAVLSWLLTRAEAAMSAGVSPESICLDPGLGFGKSVRQNWQLIAATERFVDTGHPLLAAASRKSFIGAVSGTSSPPERLPESLMVTAVQAAAGARIFRVHEVGPHLRAAQLAATD